MRIRHAGFTLLELLVALSVFSLVSVMAYSGLRTVLQSKQQTDLHAMRIHQLQSAVLMLERDIEQYVPRKVRDEYGDEQPAFSTADTGARQLAFTHAGWSNPVATARSNLQRVAYGIEDEQLVRSSWSVLDRAQDSEPYQAILLDKVRELKIRYMDTNRKWQTQWPPADLTPDEAIPSPLAIEVTLSLEDLGDIRRVFPLFAEPIPSIAANQNGTNNQGGEQEGDK